MSLRLAVFFAIPSVLLFIVAHWLDVQFLVWMAMGGAMTACFVVVLDQL